MSRFENFVLVPSLILTMTMTNPKPQSGGLVAPSPQPQPQRASNKKIVGGYSFESRLGQGSFATVYKCKLVQNSNTLTPAVVDVDNPVDVDVGVDVGVDVDEIAPLTPELVAIKAINSERLTARVKENLEMEIAILR